MGKEDLVAAAYLVLHFRPLLVGEHGESSLRNSLVIQGITTDEGSPVNPKVKTSGLVPLALTLRAPVPRRGCNRAAQGNALERGRKATTIALKGRDNRVAHRLLR